jgi:hypothetical protein
MRINRALGELRQALAWRLMGIADALMERCWWKTANRVDALALVVHGRGAPHA